MIPTEEIRNKMKELLIEMRQDMDLTCEEDHMEVVNDADSLTDRGLIDNLREYLDEYTVVTEDELEFTGAILLSVEEYEACRDIIPDTSNWWWLRSPGYGSGRAAIVRIDGNVFNYGHIVDYNYDAVRPVLYFNLKSDNLLTGDKIEVAGLTFTVISKNMMLCDTTVGESAFRKDWQAGDANVYEASDVKKFVDKWFKTIKKQ